MCYTHNICIYIYIYTYDFKKPSYKIKVLIIFLIVQQINMKNLIWTPSLNSLFMILVELLITITTFCTLGTSVFQPGFCGT